MDGVTILQTMPQYESTWGWNWEFLLFLVPVALIIALIVVGVCSDAGELIAIGIVLAFVTVIGFVTLFSAGKEVHTHDHYQVIIDESVSMTEFTEKYNVIEQQGITYIVEEKVTK